jgi:hypothetical protein
MPKIATYNSKTGGGYMASSGVVLLTFTSASTGTMSIDFDYSKTGASLPSGETVPFKAYKETWTPSASTLRVSFSIQFAHCTLPVEALFRAAP